MVKFSTIFFYFLVYIFNLQDIRKVKSNLWRLYPMNQNQIVNELKEHLSNLCQTHKIYRMSLSSDEDLAYLQKLEKDISSTRGTIYKLTGEERYNPDKEVEAKLDELSFKIMCLAMKYTYNLTAEQIEKKFKEYITQTKHPEDYCRRFNLYKERKNIKMQMSILDSLISDVKYNQLANDYAMKDISEIENLKIEF